MKTNKIKKAIFATLALVGLGLATYASCLECSNYPNNGHCYGSCSVVYATGDVCCGNTI